jgi:hypothetical protein
VTKARNDMIDLSSPDPTSHGDIDGIGRPPLCRGRSVSIVLPF